MRAWLVAMMVFAACEQGEPPKHVTYQLFDDEPPALAMHANGGMTPPPLVVAVWNDGGTRTPKNTGHIDPGRVRELVATTCARLSKLPDTWSRRPRSDAPTLRVYARCSDGVHRIVANDVALRPLLDGSIATPVGMSDIARDLTRVAGEATDPWFPDLVRVSFIPENVLGGYIELPGDLWPQFAPLDSKHLFAKGVPKIVLARPRYRGQRYVDGI
jgi:hypothetical protein